MLEEKELTIEEMKSLVSIATILPPLLAKIEQIEKSIKDLKTSFDKFIGVYNANTTAIAQHKESVDDLIKNQLDPEDFKTEIESIKNVLAGLVVSMPLNKVSQNKPITPAPTKKVQKKEEPKQTKLDEESAKIVDMILAEHRGRKTRTLTTINIKQFSKCDDETAETVLKWLEENKMYNPKTHILTFPKR